MSISSASELESSLMGFAASDASLKEREDGEKGRGVYMKEAIILNICV